MEFDEIQPNYGLLLERPVRKNKRMRVFKLSPHLPIVCVNQHPIRRRGHDPNQNGSGTMTVSHFALIPLAYISLTCYLVGDQYR